MVQFLKRCLAATAVAAIASSAVAATGVMMYSDSNFSGSSQWFGPGTYRAAWGQLNGVGDNRISSMRMYNLNGVYTCDGERYACWWFKGGDYGYVGAGQNDKISYFEVYGR